ncbi:cryptochrome/photolyase family protein [Halovenus salina]|uniref:Cryptochrome/photolyase family protein n=1 Tax=Halovenus salina TaxID=1510225 RepID=A0ABD5W3L7_9EURY|nr:deoxyribodipyrimidine photo-lyase [Halovenus salina]
MHLHWHRRDLRLSDNLGLNAGPESATLPLFVFDPAVLDNAAPPRMAFLLDSLRKLNSEYRDRDSELLLAHGSPTTVLSSLAENLDLSTVTWCRDYSGLARDRDAAVRRELDEAGVDREPVDDAVHHRPGEITTNDGDPYKVFTYFSRKWHDREKDEIPPSPGREELVTVDGIVLEQIASAIDAHEDLGRYSSVPTLAELGFDEPDAAIPEGGTERARQLLDSFCESDIYRYAERRDYPADDCSSRLSAHLKYGTIGIRTVYEATERAKSEADSDEERESVEEFQDQLAWREFYTQVLWDRPDVVTNNFKSYENDIEWREDGEDLQAWKDGETGYPIVDAGMRQLREEAFMHNRVRMIVASFLTKDLLIDWREGYDWFRTKLVDHDTANDNGGWQWAASTGTDAQPYFRVFNPMTQGERYDPDAKYIKRYVEELQGVPADVIHSWHELEPGTRRMHAADYAHPIVDHSERREQAIAMFEQARGDD